MATETQSTVISEQQCVLLVAKGDEIPHRENVTEALFGIAEAGIVAAINMGSGKPFAQIKFEDGCWQIVARDSRAVRINGGCLKRTLVMRSGDSITHADCRVWFFTNANGPWPLGPKANGFSRARHHIRRLLQMAGDDIDAVRVVIKLEANIDAAEESSELSPAIEHMRAERWQKAQKGLNGFLAKRPRHGTAWFYKAMCLVNLGDLSGALSAAEQATAYADDDELRVAARRLHGELQDVARRAGFR